MTPAASHHAAIVLDAHRADALGITHDEAERIGIEAIYLEDASDHGGTLDWWVDYVLDDIATGRRERDGRIK